MDNIYLKKPSITDEERYYDYIAEYKEYCNDSKVFCIPAQSKYKRWLKMLSLASRKSIENDGKIYFYFLIDSDILVGHIAIKDKLVTNDSDIGNIGGAIRPTMRNQGYGRKMLSLALQECQKLSLDEILISCNVDNIPSIHNIVDNGGVINRIIYDDTNNQKYNQYKIKIKER